MTRSPTHGMNGAVVDFPTRRALVPDALEALRFLGVLDPNADQFTFQTFDDDKARKDHRIARIFHGSLDQHLSELEKLNRRFGAGVFITINATDLKGRRAENVTRVRAVWADLDQGLPERFPLPPSILVQSSPGKHQAYWLVDGLTPKEHAGVLARIVEDVDADPDADGVSRVLRLPGFYHRKAEPFLVNIVGGDGRRYARQEILTAFPSTTVDHKPARQLDPDEPICELSRNKTLTSLAGTLRRRGMSAEEIAIALHGVNERRCNPPLPTKEIETIARSIGSRPAGPDRESGVEDDFGDVTGSSDSLATEVDRLARLSPLEYEQARAKTAEQLGVRVGVLDDEVAKRRIALQEQDGQGAFIKDVEPWSEPVDGHDLLEALIVTLGTYAVLPSDTELAIALWILHAHAHDAAVISPILAIQSPEKQCGKTTVMGLVSLLAPKPLPASNLSSAVLFRVVDKLKPTLLIDEADTFLDFNEELRGVLNSSHNRSGACVWRCVGDDQEPKPFSTWAPIVIVRIGELADTLQDRSIVVSLRRMLPGEHIQRLRQDRTADFAVLRSKLARWARDNATGLAQRDPQIPEHLSNRAADNWRPLIAIADQIGGGWGKLAREAAGRISDTIHAASEPARGQMVLADCRRVFEEKACDQLSPSELIVGLLNLEDADWSTHNYGRPITAKYMARLLKPYGISAQKCGDGSRRYWRASFCEAWTRYLPNGGDDARVEQPPPTPTPIPPSEKTVIPAVSAIS